MGQFTENLREARLALGLSEHETAEKAGMSSPAYYDLEQVDDDYLSAYSIADLLKVSVAVKRQLIDLLKIPCEIPSTSIADLQHALKIAHAESGLDLHQFESELGWEISHLLQEPDSIFDFNIDGLTDICGPVGIDWQGVIKSLE